MSSSFSSSSSSRKPQPPSTISQSSIFDLKSILSEHKDKFAKEGKGSVRGGSGREERRRSELSRDKFSRPSPNLSTRLARQSTSSSAERLSRPSEEQRLALMQKKAELYDKLQRGELEGVGEREMGEWVVDFESKWNEQDSDGFSNHSSDVDESASVPLPDTAAGRRGSKSGRDNGWEGMKSRNGKGKEKEKETKKMTEEDFENFEDNYVQVEYTDELGRTRTGTRKEAKEAEKEKQRLREGGGGGGIGGEVDGDGVREGREEIGLAHQEVLQSNVIYGAQSLFPVYEPTQEDLIARLKAQDSGGPLETHYDSTREVRARAAGAYQFSLDEEERKKQMEELKKERVETEMKREERGGVGKGVNKVEEARKRKLEERRALIEAKRIKMMGGKEALEKARQDLRERAAESFLEGLELTKDEKPVAQSTE